MGGGGLAEGLVEGRVFQGVAEEGINRNEDPEMKAMAKQPKKGGRVHVGVVAQPVVIEEGAAEDGEYAGEADADHEDGRNDDSEADSRVLPPMVIDHARCPR